MSEEATLEVSPKIAEVLDTIEKLTVLEERPIVLGNGVVHHRYFVEVLNAQRQLFFFVGCGVLPIPKDTAK